MPKGVYALAATNGEKTGVMLAVKEYEGELELHINNNNGSSYRVTESTYQNHEQTYEEKLNGNNTIKLTVKKDSIYYIEIN